MKKISRKEQALQTEQAIIQALQLLVQTKPFQEIQIKDICAKAGISNGNFYHYFPNKNSLIIKLLQNYEKDFSSIVKDNTIPLKKQTSYLHFERLCKTKGREVLIFQYG
jgi:AcrR family transcriptional regulator